MTCNVLCFRCGEVFCGKCTQFRRRLSILATPDPDGISYRVCRACYDVGPQTLGVTNSSTKDFKIHRHYCRTNSINQKSGSSEKVNFIKECDRLVQGFQKEVGSSRIKNFVLKTVGSMAVPAWQKSKHWTAKCDTCMLCFKTFTITDLKSHCRVCGHVICSSCSSDTLIVYVDDNSSKVMWSLINIIGSPDKEPAVCLYLRICNHCHSGVAEIQGRAVIEAERTLIDGPSMLDNVSDIHGSLVKTQNKITALLPKYESLVDAVEAKGELKGVVGEGQSATQTLAKYHLDLSDLFTQFAVDMQGLRRLKPRTNAQMKLARNLTQGKFGFYNDNFPAYRECKKRLDEVLPSQILESMQKIVDEQAINNAYIVIKQLGLEALILATTHDIPDTVPLILARCEEVCIEDLKKQIQQYRGDWEAHLSTVTELLQIQIKEHRLVKPSRTYTKSYGARYVQEYLVERVHILLRQTTRQLGDKTTGKTFRTTKQALETANGQITALK
ncbi:vacuolar segregation protein PEP7 isoform X2 [Nematostella vectensis]|uniref:vacuolar segregation protein PEP7 isoform X2 n=1 Tax=Nematostella vectensis TaxID=45351 RepID=UPI0013905526|nr:vacuolar segregation protein PEP7 isoform X2 [Nematostella vectensis]XP_032229075.1 vacuolar segregation protein PEP7 isoform X2 [Nematostella vectensis]